MAQNQLSRRLRVGTRGSLLARLQTGWVVSRLQSLAPEMEIETIQIRSTGDRIQDRPLHEFGGKGLFTKELELALIDQTIDLAVHSFKDVPVTMPLVEQAELIFAAVPGREDPRDALISLKARSIDELPRGARVGTGSLRRRCQLLERRPDLVIEPIRGNIDTRLGKLKAGEYDAIVLAMAGLRRAGLWDDAIMTPLPLEAMLPAAGQGALALQCRASDQLTRELLSRIDDPRQRRCVEAERAVVQALNGDCHSPIAALAIAHGEELDLSCAVGERDGTPPVRRAKARGLDPAEIARAAVEQLGAAH